MQAGISTSRAPAIVWLRDDLRLDDNPALVAAIGSGRPVLLVHVLDEVSAGLRPLGGAARWWLHHSLEALGREVTARGGRLILRSGPAQIVIANIVDEIGAAELHWNRRIDAAGREIDAELKRSLRERGVRVESHRANLLHEPWTLSTRTGGPFRVFTPFWKAFLASGEPPTPQPAPAALRGWTGEIESDDLAIRRLLPTRPDWAGGLATTWTPGEAGARARLTAFLDMGINSYSRDRDFPALDGTSRLAAHLRFGEISPHRVWHEVRAAAGARDGGAGDGGAGGGAEKFLSEIGWREFSHHLLFHFPDLATRNFQAKFDAFPWADDPRLLEAWQEGRTGYPLVDAGLRQLWATGGMHNRVRMVAASFLVKHGLVDWRAGEAWFWDTLVDACPADNPASWQWVAGSGADAAPYFRIFNPVAQGEKFDPDGAYVRQWVPELANLEGASIHTPWVARARGRRPQGDYPAPIVEHGAARERALAAFASIGAASVRVEDAGNESRNARSPGPSSGHD